MDAMTTEPPPQPMLHRVLLVIGGLTIVSGAVQVLVPQFILRLLSAKRDTTSRALFATVGMFMVVAGGTLVQGLLSPVRQPIIVLWAAIQKLGAALFVCNGVRRGVFSKLALAVAGFDLLTSVLSAVHWARLRKV